MVFIYHLADIHIHNKINDRIKFAFDKLLDDIDNVINMANTDIINVIVVIAGDIFEYKTIEKTTIEDKQLFIYMMNSLNSRNIPTVIIPGNHDYNASTPDIDIISNISNVFTNSWTSIHYLKYTQVFDLPDTNIRFFTYSPIDGKIPDQVLSDDKYNIAIVHESINGSVACNDFILTSDKFKDDFIQYDITMLGDIHKYQFLDNQIAYPGSLVQKNKGESCIDHGYIVWHISDEKDTTTIKSEFKSLPAFKTDIIIKLNEEQDTINYPLVKDPSSILIKYTNCSMKYIKKLVKDTAEYYSINSVLITTDASNDQVNHDDVKLITSGKVTIEDFIKNSSSDDELVQKCLKIHEQHTKDNNTSQQKRRWKLKTLEWENIYKYIDYSFIDFTTLEGLTLLCGENTVGKSSIIHILLYILFSKKTGNPDKFLNKELLLNNNVDNTKNGFIRLTIEDMSDTYSICRVIKRKSSSTDDITLRKNNNIISSGDIIQTYEKFAEITGDQTDISLVSIAKQFRSSFFQLTDEAKKKFISKVLGIEEYSKIADKNKSKLLSIRRDIKTLTELLSITDFDKHLSEIKSNRNEVQTQESMIAVYEQSISTLTERYTKLLAKSNNKEICDIDEIKYKLDQWCNAMAKIDKSIIDYNIVQEVATEYKKTVSQKKEKIVKIKQLLNIPTVKVDIDNSRIDKLIPNSLDSEYEDIILMNSTLVNSLQYDDTLIEQYEPSMEETAKIQCIKPVKYTINTKLDMIDNLHEIPYSKSEIEQYMREYYINRSAVDINHELQKYQSVGINSINNDNSSIEDITLDIAKIDVEIEQLKLYLTKYSKFEYNEPIVHKSQINNQEREITTEILAKLKERTVPVDRLVELTTEMQTIKSDISQIKIQQKDQDPEIKKKIESLKTTACNKFKYDDKCSCCRENKNKISPVQSSIQEYHDRESRLQLLKTKYESKKNAYTHQLMNLVRYWNARMKYVLAEKEALRYKYELYKQAKKIKQLHVDLQKAIQYEKYSLMLKQYEENEQLKHITEYNKQYSLYNKVQIAKNTIVKRQYDQLIDKLTIKINELIVIYNKLLLKYTNTIDYHRCQTNIDQCNRILEEYTTYETINNDIKQYEKELEEYRKKVKQLQDSVKENSIALKEKETKYNEQYTIYEKKKILDEELIVRTHYQDLFNNKTGIIGKIIQNKSMIIEQLWNQKLRKVCDYTIKIDFTKNNFNVQMVEKGTPISIEVASGYQRFILDLTFRETMFKMAEITLPDFLIIDEGFDVADDSNRKKIKMYLDMIKDEYPFILIVTHIKDIQDITTSQLRITCNENKTSSVIRIGQLTRPEIEINTTMVKKSNAELTQLKIAAALNGEDQSVKDYNKIGYDETADDTFVMLCREDSKYYCKACNKVLGTKKTADKHLQAKTHVAKLITYMEQKTN